MARCVAGCSCHVIHWCLIHVYTNYGICNIAGAAASSRILTVYALISNGLEANTSSSGLHTMFDRGYPLRSIGRCPRRCGRLSKWRPIGVSSDYCRTVLRVSDLAVISIAERGGTRRPCGWIVIRMDWQVVFYGATLGARLSSRHWNERRPASPCGLVQGTFSALICASDYFITCDMPRDTRRIGYRAH